MCWLSKGPGRCLWELRSTQEGDAAPHLWGSCPGCALVPLPTPAVAAGWAWPLPCSQGLCTSVALSPPTVLVLCTWAVKQLHPKFRR